MHAQFGARRNVTQTRKMGVLPAQKCPGDALWAYLSGRDVGWYGCTSSARSAIHPPPWSLPVAQPVTPDVYPSGALSVPARRARFENVLNPLLDMFLLDTQSFFERNTDSQTYQR